MKRYLAIFLVIATLLCILPVSAVEAASKPIEVFYLGEKLEFPVPPQIIGGSTMVPMRAIFEALGYLIEWDAETKTVAAYLGGDTIALTIGEKEAYINGTAQPLAAPAALVNGSTLVPLRFIGEASGYLVDWHDADRSVTIDYTDEMKKANEAKQQSIIDELKTVKSDLIAKHVNLFFSKSRDEFNAEMDALIKSVPSKTEAEIQFELMRIVNSVGDSHTAAGIENEYVFDLSFFEFKEGIYLRDSTKAYESFIGKRLTAINGMPLEEVLKKLTPIIPQENSALIKNRFASFLSLPCYLKIAGVINSFGNVAFQFGDKTLYASASSSAGEPVSISEASSKYPLSYTQGDRNYWYTSLDDKKTMYVKYNRCMEGSTSFSQFTEDVFSELDAKKSTTLIIDLRDNGGGSSPLFDPFLAAIKKRPKINADGHLYVIVGRRTFSSAILNTMSLKLDTKAIFVGETTGGSPNHYGQVSSFPLPILKMSVSYSTKFFRRDPQSVHTFTPDIAVAPTAASFFSGKDDFLEAVFARMAK